jgi:hypothetical protein
MNTKVEPMLSLLYFRPGDHRCTPLDEKLFDIAARHRGCLRLIVKHTDESGTCFGGWVSGNSPTVLFVHDGQSVAQLIGDLPLWEIEDLVRSALAAAHLSEAVAR